MIVPGLLPLLYSAHFLQGGGNGTPLPAGSERAWMIGVGLVVFVLVAMPLVGALTFIDRLRKPLTRVARGDVRRDEERDLARGAAALEALGFTPEGLFREPVRHARGTWALYVSRTESVIASLGWVRPDSPRLPTGFLAGFTTQYPDGTSISTVSTPAVSAFARTPDRREFHLPGERRLPVLLDAHRKLVAMHAPAGAAPVLPDSIVDWFADENARTLAAPRERGWLRTTGDAGEVRLSAKGILLFTFAHAVPNLWIRRWRAARKTKRLLRASGGARRPAPMAAPSAAEAGAAMDRLAGPRSAS